MAHTTNLDANKTKRLPYLYYITPIIILIFLGLVDTVYLSYSHYKNYTDIEYSSFCALSEAINCDTVAQSPWSIFLGLPVAVWGLLGYTLFGTILSNTVRLSQKKLYLWHALFLLSGVYSLIAVYFAYISTTYIKSHCILCLFSYIISFSLLFLSWIVLRRFDCNSFSKSLKKFWKLLFYSGNNYPIKIAFLGLFGLFLLLKLYYPHYWNYTFPPPSQIATGITDEGVPWIGATEPVLTIEEFTDYQCFQCKKTHLMLRQLIAKHPDKIRLLHYHYPMDHEFNSIVVPTQYHKGSGKMALLAIYAAHHNKLWEMNDLLFTLGEKRQAFSLQQVSDKTGIPVQELHYALQSSDTRKLLRRDIHRGMKLRITGTPSFVIDGRVYSGYIPPELLNRLGVNE